MFKKSLDYGQAGDNIGVLLRGVKREDVTRGQILTQPNTVKTYKKFTVRSSVAYCTANNPCSFQNNLTSNILLAPANNVQLTD